MVDSSADSWRPTAKLETLLHRSELLWQIREFFHAAGFAEVQTPVISHDTVIDRHIDPVCLPACSLNCLQAGAGLVFLQTSPEFGMKRLVAAGMQAIYQIGPVFRAGERGDYHNPEFTMVEWYKVGDNLSSAIAFLDQLICRALNCCSCAVYSYPEVFARYAGIEPLTASVSQLADIARLSNLDVTPSFSNDKDDWLNLIFSECVQPKLGLERPAIITNYPASQAALARVSDTLAGTAERFELFVQGVELANGYHELLDARELENRTSMVQQQRLLDGKQPLPASNRLLAAMRHGLPACSGCALGLDRLLMVACNLKRIEQVIPFPIERA